MKQEIATQDMRKWQLKQLRCLLSHPPSHLGPSSITIVIWHYWQNEEVFNNEFRYIEMAIRETWKQFGLLKTLLIVNRITSSIERLCMQFPDRVRFDYCKDLQPGNLYSMCYDAIENLHRRVDTDYVLYVHPDGWALRPGIEEFMGKYDYIGAPWAEWQKPHGLGKLLLLGGKHVGGVGNGGFSLRSRKLFEIGAWYYKRKYKLIPDCFFFYEDIYYTMFLPSYERMYRDIARMAPPEEAAKFALNDNFDLYKKSGEMPLGFHSNRAFSQLVQDRFISYKVEEIGDLNED